MLNEADRVGSIDSEAPAEPAVAPNSPNLHIGENALRQKQQAAAEMLAQGKSYEEICRFLKIHRKTLYNWRRSALFAEATDARRRELWKDAADRLSRLVHPALDTMEEFLCDVYDKNRMRAATAVLRISNIGKAMPKLNAGEAGEVVV